MTHNQHKSRPPLAKAAIDALKEADERRQKEKHDLEGASHVRPKETNGREGPEPTRYGDWEKKGIISDF